MTSRKEREEIAKKLREVGKGNSGWFMTTRAAFFKISDIISAQCKSYEFFFNRLADLINPTCHLVEVDNEGETSYVCSSCGNFGSEEVQLLDAFNYCPVCGARVVRDDG